VTNGLRLALPRLMGAALACVVLAVPVLSFAQVTVGDPWVRATVPQQQASGAFMTLTSPQGARLVEASSPVAGTVEVHEMKRDGDVMRMRSISSLELPAGRAVKLQPGGYHVMLMDLKQTLNAGDTIPLTLVFETADRKRETVEVKAPVRPLSSGSAAPAHKH
jgi:copper(I)-binding protein